MFRDRATIIYVGSLLLHAGVAAAIVRMKAPKVYETTRISMVEHKAKAPKAEPLAPPPPPPSAVHRAAKKAAAPAPAAPAPAAAPEVASFGLTLSGGVGVGAGTGGVAVPVGPTTKVAPTTTKRTAAPKALAARHEAAQDETCIEQLVKPKPIAIPQPVYADRAREAGVQGKVRVELTVDESGSVVEARVLEGLGYGLDEAALEAAKSSRFEPATRCGKPARATFVIGIRFTL